MKNPIQDTLGIPVSSSYMSAVIRQYHLEMESVWGKLIGKIVAMEPETTRAWFYDTSMMTPYGVKVTYHRLMTDNSGTVMVPDGVSGVIEINLDTFRELVKNGVIKI